MTIDLEIPSARPDPVDPGLATSESLQNMAIFQPKSQHVQQALRDHPDVLDHASASFLTAEDVARTDTFWLAWEEEEALEDWRRYDEEQRFRAKLRRQLRSRTTSVATKLTIQEYLRSCPNLPPKSLRPISTS